MRPFHLEPGMKTLRGVFYPTGWMVLMLPGEQQALEAARLLEQNGINGDALMLMTPQDARRELAAGDDNMLPSAGSEGDTVRKIVEQGGRVYMPPFKEIFTQEAVWAIRSYVDSKKPD